MKTRLYLITICFFFSITTFAQAPAWLWAKSTGGIFSQSGNGIAVDANGNTFITGDFGNTIIFDTITLIGSSVNNNFFIVKYDGLGHALWAKSCTGLSNGIQTGTCIAVDAHGNSYVAGNFSSGSITFDNITLTHSGSAEIFIVKYDSIGNVVWAKKAGGPYQDQAFGIAVDANDNVFVTGSTTSLTIHFGNISLTNTFGGNVFIVKYDSSGIAQWAKIAGGIMSLSASSTTGNSISVDANGNSYLTGNFACLVLSFDSITLPINYPYSNQIFIAKFNSSGNVLWAKRIGGSYSQVSKAITTDAIGNSYITGYFIDDSLILGNTILINNTDSPAFFVAKYDSSGNAVWANGAIASAGVVSKSISVDSNENCCVAGNFFGDTLIFGNTTLINHSNNNYHDLFIAKYDSSGNVLWAKSAGNDMYDFCNGIAVDKLGNSYVTGSFNSDSLMLDNILLSNNVMPGLGDFYIAKLGSGIPTQIQINLSNSIITIYPNPTNSHFTITSPSIIDEITITDVMGRMIYTAKPKEKIAEKKLEREGIYFVTLRSGDERATRKVVVE